MVVSLDTLDCNNVAHIVYIRNVTLPDCNKHEGLELYISM